MELDLEAELDWKGVLKAKDGGHGGGYKHQEYEQSISKYANKYGVNAPGGETGYGGYYRTLPTLDMKRIGTDTQLRVHTM